MSIIKKLLFSFLIIVMVYSWSGCTAMFFHHKPQWEEIKYSEVRHYSGQTVCIGDREKIKNNDVKLCGIVAP